MFRNRAVHGVFTTDGAAGQNLVTFVAIIHLGDFSFDEPLVTAVDADPKMAIARREIRQGMLDKIAKPQNNVSGLAIFTHIRDETKMSERADGQGDARDRDAGDPGPAAGLRCATLPRTSSASSCSTRRKSTNRSSTIGRSGTRSAGAASSGASSGRPRQAQEASYPYLAMLDSIYQPERNGRVAAGTVRRRDRAGAAGRRAGDRSWRSRWPRSA